MNKTEIIRIFVQNQQASIGSRSFVEADWKALEMRLDDALARKDERDLGRILAESKRLCLEQRLPALLTDVSKSDLARIKPMYCSSLKSALTSKDAPQGMARLACYAGSLDYVICHEWLAKRISNALPGEQHIVTSDLYLVHQHLGYGFRVLRDMRLERRRRILFNSEYKQLFAADLKPFCWKSVPLPEP